MFTSIRWKLITIAIAMVLLTALPLLFVSSKMTNSTVQQMHRDAVTQEAAAINEIITSTFTNIRRNVEMFSHSTLLQQAGDTLPNYVNAQKVRMDASKRPGKSQQLFAKFKEYGQSHPQSSFTCFGTRFGGFVDYPEKVRTNYDPRSRS